MSALERINAIRRRLLLAPVGIGIALVLKPRYAVAQSPSGSKFPIGVIGSGRIGGTIGGLWVKAGHPVLFSSRHPDELKELVARLGPLAQAGTVAEAIKFGDVIFVAVPYAALPEIGRDYGAVLKGTIVLDACNAVQSRDGDIAQEAERDGVAMTRKNTLPARASCVHSTRCRTRSSRGRPIGPNRAWRCRSRATMPKQ